ncbi:YdiY family protein [Erythrobacter sp. JK5]|uniref:DUF481 domain-containing protein n=1 Tax=Erythrobacter sp. JK5 TaxID=2829500 RepID=UPI001BABE066|nr:DUF481 domain-containing protein [Erythrobacter sp. JK5]QUL38132.1 DUF481 domain-containing protein [Erythrobacter sp. JK5]
MKNTILAASVATSALFLATPANAELPGPVRAMIDAAIERGDEEAVRTVIDLARQTNPDDGAELDTILSDYEADLAAVAADAAAAEAAAIRDAGLFENWTGKGELGAFRSTGNSDNAGVTAGLKLTREGIDWRHKFRARVDYQETAGVVTREQFLAAYEPNWKITDRLFAYALGQYERDRFQGFSARYSTSGGLGYDVIDNDSMALSVKAGPAWRRTELVGGGSTSRIAALAAADFDWQIAENLVFTEDASAFIQGGSSTYISDTGLQAAIAGNFSVRLSYTVEHDTDPPLGAVKTDTLSRVTLIYDF